MKRKQLTLFLDKTEAIPIESIRKRFNPIQHDVIASHITLCREDEIEDLEFILKSLNHIKMHKFRLQTNGLKRFDEGRGLLIEIDDNENKFCELREKILKREKSVPRKHKAHITLMHPRNSSCNDKLFKEILKSELPPTLSINKISLIEQEIGMKWKILKEYKLL